MQDCSYYQLVGSGSSLVKQKLGISVLIKIGICSKSIAMATARRGHFVSFVVYINGPKFEEHSSNIPRNIHDSVLHLFVEQLMTSSFSSFA